MKPKSKILIIAGSDSSGGAGIQADIKTVTALGSYAMTAITAITSQNTTGVKSIESITPREISKQIEFTSKDISPDAIKIGMLHSAEVINTVLKSLNKINVKKIILDPVMVAKGGTKLIDNRSIRILKLKLIKKVSLITPNIPEAEILTKKRISSVDDMISAARILMSLGAKNVLIKGGHLKSRIMQDIFLNKNEISVFKNKKINISFLFKKISCIILDLRWPPFINTFFAPKFSKIFAAWIISFTEEIFIFVKISASGMFGVIKLTSFINLDFKILIERLLISLAPPLAAITGSKIIFFTFIFLKDFNTALITSTEWSIPILITSGLISFDVNSICFDISLEDIDAIDFTPVVFCEVTAVIAVIAYEPSAVTVLMSACIPAPPEESDPAIINTLELGFNLLNRSFNDVNTF